MRIVNNNNYAFGFIFGHVNFPKHSVTLVAKKTWKYDLAGNLTEPEDTPAFEGDVLSKSAPPYCLYDADLAVFKPNAEALLTGTCYVPNGESKTLFDCAFKVGEWSKVLAVIGNRTWQKKLIGSKMSEPEPFTKVELSWAHAFGGEKVSANPAGTGFKQGMLPNIEYPEALMKGAGDKPEPACFGPIHRQWKHRAGKMGTYDKKWLKERWPAQAADFDWSYYNAASADQQIQGFLRGDESVELVHMHAEQARINFKLNGRAPRMFFRNIDNETTIESPMNLDTLFVDAENMLVHAVWRGVNDIADDVWSQCDAVVVADDDALQPAAAETFYPLFVEEVEETEDEPAEAQAAQTPEEFEAKIEAEFKAADDELKKHIDGFVSRSKDKLPPEFNPAMLTKPQPADFSKVPDAIRAATSKAAAAGAIIPSEAVNLADDVEAGLKQLEAETSEQEAVEVPPIAMIKSGEAAGGDFSDVDFSGQDMSGADLKGATFTNVNFAGADLSSADLSGAYFQNTNLEKANLEQAKLNDASLSDCNLKGINLAKAEGTHSTFLNCEASGAKFNDSNFADTSFVDSNFESAEFTGAEFLRANIINSNLSAVLFADANLSEASFIECELTKTNFENAKLTSASFSGSKDASDLNAENADAPDSNWDKLTLIGANFKGANLEAAQFSGCNLEGANLSSANLAKSNLMGANLHSATIVTTNLFQAMLSKADLTDANLLAANLYEADLFQAKTEGANLSDATIKGTLLNK